MELLVNTFYTGWVCVCAPILTLNHVPEVLLTSSSANHRLTDKDGNSALHLACSSVSVQRCFCVRSFISLCYFIFNSKNVLDHFFITSAFQYSNFQKNKKLKKISNAFKQ